MVEYLNMILLQIYWERKKIKNRLIFGEVMGRSLVSCFLIHSVYMPVGLLFSFCFVVFGLFSRIPFSRLR